MFDNLPNYEQAIVENKDKNKKICFAENPLNAYQLQLENEWNKAAAGMKLYILYIFKIQGDFFIYIYLRFAKD